MRKIIRNNKVISVKDADLQEDDVVLNEGNTVDEAQTEDAPELVDQETEEAVDEEVDAKRLGRTMAREFMAVINSDKKKVEAVERFIDQPGNEKLYKILAGKDLLRDKGKLTSEEKIVGFFHALVTRNTVAIKALSEGTAADGGYLFPDEFLAELVRPLSDSPRARALVRVVTMRRDVMKIPTLTSGPQVYWTAENAAKTTTTAAFYEATLTARKAAAILYASDELIEDSEYIDVVQLIITLFAEAIGREEDRVILRGNGTTEPTGIVTARAAGTIASAACSGNLDGDDIIDLVYLLPAKYRNGSSFIVHPNNVKELRKLKDSNGQYIWEPSLKEGVPDRLMGYPVNEFYDMPESEMLFGNWKLCYYLGDRKKMTVKVSNDTETAFTKDQTAIRVVIRIAGNVVLADAARGLISIP